MFGLLSENTSIHETEYHYEVKMREYIGNILQKIDTEIDEIDLYGYDIIETSLSMVHKLQTVLYASYIAMKERKDRTAYLHHLLIDSLSKRMNEDDMKY